MDIHSPSYLPLLTISYISPQADLPDDEAATDIVLETIAGLEMYQLLKASTDLEVQRRILISKWLYVQGTHLFLMKCPSPFLMKSPSPFSYEVPFTLLL